MSRGHSVGRNTTAKQVARALIISQIEKISDDAIRRRVGNKKAADVRQEIDRLIRVLEFMS